MLHLLVSLWCKNTFSVGVGGKMNPRIRLTSAKVEVGVEVEAEHGKIQYSLVAPGTLAHHTDCNIQNCLQGAPMVTDCKTTTWANVANSGY